MLRLPAARGRSSPALSWRGATGTTHRTNGPATEHREMERSRLKKRTEEREGKNKEKKGKGKKGKRKKKKEER